jgi:hypothetical protein
MVDAPEKDAGPSDHPAKSTKKVSFSGKAVEVGTGAGEAPKWKKKSQALFRLDHLQEEAMYQPLWQHLFREPASLRRYVLPVAPKSHGGLI